LCSLSFDRGGGQKIGVVLDRFCTLELLIGFTYRNHKDNQLELFPPGL